MQNARLSLLWYSVARSKQQENSHQQVGSARASPLVFSPIAVQPRRFSFYQKLREMRSARFPLLWHSVARGKQQEKHSPASRSVRAGPHTFSPITSQPHRFSPPRYGPSQ